MRYGLKRDSKEHDSKLWKTMMEAQIEVLKKDLIIKENELKICSLQLRELSDRTTENSSINKDLLEKIEKLERKLNEHLNSRTATSTNPFSVASFSASKQANSLQKHDTNGRNMDCSGSEVKFQPVIAMENTGEPARMWNVSVMPSCRNWSPEELRWQHRNTAYQAEPCFFLSGTTLYRFSPTKGTDTKVGFGGPQQIKTKIMNITAMPHYNNKSPEELRLEDYTLKKPSFLNQKPTLLERAAQSYAKYLQTFPCPSRIPPPPPPKWNFILNKSTSSNTTDSRMETKEDSTSAEGTSDQALGQPLLLQNILKELKGMSDKFASLESRFNTLEKGISNVSTRMSVMDSKLSSVDMFLTMERFGKKWNALESKLAFLESPVVVANDLITSINDKEVQCSFLKDDDEEAKASQITEGKLLTESPEVFSFGIQSEEKGCKLFKWCHRIEISDVLTSNDKPVEENITEYTDSVVDLSSTNKDNNFDGKKIPPENCNISVGTCLTDVESDNNCKIESPSKTINKENDTEPNSATKEIDNVQKEQFTQSEVDGKSPILNEYEETDKILLVKTPPNEEDDFVVVEKSDFLNSTENDSCAELNLPDVTEYLEIASAKINRTYELGVEVTDTSMLELSADVSPSEVSPRVDTSLMSLGSPPTHEKKTYFDCELPSSDK